MWTRLLSLFSYNDSVDTTVNVDVSLNGTFTRLVSVYDKTRIATISKGAQIVSYRIFALASAKKA